MGEDRVAHLLPFLKKESGHYEMTFLAYRLPPLSSG